MHIPYRNDSHLKHRPAQWRKVVFSLDDELSHISNKSEWASWRITTEKKDKSFHWKDGEEGWIIITVGLFILPLWAFMGNPKSHVSGAGNLAGRQKKMLSCISILVVTWKYDFAMGVSCLSRNDWTQHTCNQKEMNLASRQDGSSYPHFLPLAAPAGKWLRAGWRRAESVLPLLSSELRQQRPVSVVKSDSNWHCWRGTGRWLRKRRPVTGSALPCVWIKAFQRSRMSCQRTPCRFPESKSSNLVLNNPTL